jgi:hypothetical protein
MAMFRHVNLRALSAFIAICWACAATARGDLNFSYYYLRGDVWQDPLGSHFETIASDMPTSPVSENIHLAVGQSTLNAAYGLSFDTQSILLDSQSQHAITYYQESGSMSRASITITPTTPVEVTVAGSFAYDFTDWDIEGDTYLGLAFSIVLPDSQTVLHSLEASPIAFPGSGIATLAETFILPADQSYGIGFDAFTYTFGDFAGNTATAQSEIAITVESIPEPGSAVCLLAATFVLRLRRGY